MTKKPLVGGMFDADVTYLDFFNPSTTTFYQEGMKNL
jgi:hypothetical protein